MNRDTLKELVVYLTNKELKVLLNLLEECPDEDCDTLFTKLKNKLSDKTLSVFDNMEKL